MYDSVCFCMIVFDSVWFCVNMYDYVWFCMILYDYVWFCMVIYDSALCCMILRINCHYILQRHWQFDILNCVSMRCEQNRYL